MIIGLDYIIFVAFSYCYIRMGCGWFSTVRSYFLLLIVVSSLTYLNIFLEYCEYDSEVAEHGISCCVRGVHDLGCLHGIVVFVGIVIHVRYVRSKSGSVWIMIMGCVYWN